LVPIILIGFGGAAGALLRHIIAVWCRLQWGDRFPWGTLLINLSGAFLIGWVTSHILPSSPWRPPLIIGGLGGFTTFSTWMLEVVRLRQSQHWNLALIYTLVAGLGGPLMVLLGLQLGGGLI
jgi:CrcB protein